MFTRHLGDYRWEGVSLLEYKEEGSHFKAITRQILFAGLADLPCQLRYFEIAPGGYSTLEKHHHIHLVLIARGAGQVLLGERINQVQEHDLFVVESGQWHQLRATADQPLGFYCLVNSERDRPVRPNAADLEALRQDPAVAAFIRS